MDNLIFNILLQFSLDFFELKNINNNNNCFNNFILFDNLIETTYDINFSYEFKKTIRKKTYDVDNIKYFSGYYYNNNDISDTIEIHKLYENFIKLSKLLKEYDGDIFIIPQNYLEMNSIIYPDYSQIEIVFDKNNIPFFNEHLVSNINNDYILDDNIIFNNANIFNDVASPINFDANSYFYSIFQGRSNNILCKINLESVINIDQFRKIKIINPQIIKMINRQRIINNINYYDLIQIGPFTSTNHNETNVTNNIDVKKKLINLCKMLSQDHYKIYLVDKENNSYDYYDLSSIQAQQNIGMGNHNNLNFYIFEKQALRKNSYLVFKNDQFKIFFHDVKYKKKQRDLIKDKITEYFETNLIDLEIFN